MSNTFQTTVSLFQGAAVPGELFSDAPHIARSYICDSNGQPQIIGATGFSVTSQGIANAGNTGGTQIFAGILSNPKQQVSFGTTVGGPLAPTMTIPDNTQADLVTMGQLWVTLPADCNIGDLVCYNNTTGALTTIARGAHLAVGTSFAFATVIYLTPNFGAPQLAAIELDPTLPIPTLA